MSILVNMFVVSNDYNHVFKAIDVIKGKLLGIDLITEKLVAIPESRTHKLTATDPFWRMKYDQDTMVGLAEVLLDNVKQRAKYLDMSVRSYMRYLAEYKSK